MKQVSLIFIAVFYCLTAQSQTVGLIQRSDSSISDGYVLFAPSTRTTTYLIDKCGKQVKTWNSAYRTGHMVYLLPDGNLLRAGNILNPVFNAGGTGGIIEKTDWGDNIIWSYKISDGLKCQHHDIKALPNGNVLAVVWESKTSAEAIANGRDPARTASTVWSEQILEIKPIGKDSGVVVWEWHLWDHLVQEFDPMLPNFGPVPGSPQLMDINYGAKPGLKDWLHINSIDYNADLDQIMVSVLNTNEIWIIDHSTTTAEAASHTGGKAGQGGDLLYRWGNPQAYQIGMATDQKLFGQHNARWVEKGFPYADQIMVFNNGAGRTGGPDSLYTTVEIINPPISGFTYALALPYLPTSPSWIYNKGNVHNFFATNTSGAQPLSNGNVLLTHGPFGTFTEITSSGKSVWKYINPAATAGILKQDSTPVGNSVFRSTYYPTSFSGFVGHTMVAGSIIENLNPVSDTCTIKKVNIAEKSILNDFKIFPNPAYGLLSVSVSNVSNNATIKIINNLGQNVHQSNIDNNATLITIPINDLPNGMYFVQIQAGETVLTKKLLVEN